MIRLVQRKKWNIIKNRRIKLPRINMFIKFNPKVIKILLIITFFVFLIFALIYIFKKTVFLPENIIQIVNYNQSSINQYDEPYLYKKVSTLIKWQNYYRTKYFNQWKILDQVFKEFPIINDFEINYVKNNVVNVKIFFNKPDLVIKNQDLSFWIYRWYTFQIYSGNTIWSWAQKIYLPGYLSWVNSIDWIFFDITFDDFINKMYSILKNFPENKRVIYLPWWERTIVEMDESRRIYINNAKDLDLQFKNYALLKKYYSNFANLKEVDLWSLETDKIIVSG